MSTSRTELALTDIVTEFELISTASGFRTDPANIFKAIRSPNKIVEWPEIGIEFGDEVLKPEDDGWTVFTTELPVYVVGTIKANTEEDDEGTNLRLEMEKLLHDMRRTVVSLLTKYITSATNRWNVTPNQEIVFERILGFDENKINFGQVATKFRIQVRWQDDTFA